MLLRDGRLRAFHSVAKHRSFTSAARHLLLTQQAVSFQIKSLEEEIGGPLFRRELRAVELTPLGSAFFTYAERILELYSEAEAELANPGRKLQGILRISATNSLAKYVIPSAIGALRRVNPEVRVTMEVGNSKFCLDCLQNGLVDVAFVSDGPARLRTFDVELFFEDEIAVIAPPDHPWVRRRDVDFDALCVEPLILREEGSGTRALLDRAMAERAMSIDKLDIVSVLGSAEAVKGAVVAGAGIGIVSRLSLRRELVDGSLKIISVDNFRLVRRFSIARTTQGILHRRTKDFIEFAKKAIE